MDPVGLCRPVQVASGQRKFPTAHLGRRLRVLQKVGIGSEIFSISARLSDIKHEPTQPARAALLGYHFDDIAQPDGTAIRSDEAIFEIVVLQPARA